VSALVKASISGYYAALHQQPLCVFQLSIIRTTNYINVCY